jgi:hypothetical protein
MTRLSAAAVLVFVSGCTTITEELPQRPTPPITIPAPIIVVPVPIPSPAAPNPTPPPTTPPNPGPNPGPTPTPAPGPPPSTQSCSLPALPDHGNCSKEGPVFLSQVESAIDQVIAESPQFFNLRDGGPCGNCYKVVNVPGYEAGVVRALQQRGLCAHSGEEFGVKNTNSFNEQYDLLTSTLYIRRQAGSYQLTCRPAAF